MLQKVIGLLVTGLLIIIPSTVRACPNYVDVECDQSWAKYVEAIDNAGITRGCDPTHFCPRDNVTRAQMALFLARAIGGLNDHPIPASSRFVDVPRDLWNPGYPPTEVFRAIEYIADAANNPLGRADWKGTWEEWEF